MLQEKIVKKTITLFSCLLLSLVFWGCNGETPTVSNGEENTTSENVRVNEGEEKEKKKVLTSFTILADMAQNVAGDRLIVESITRIGAEIHGYEPTPKDLVRAQGADLVLYNGMNLERWMSQFLGNLQDTPSVIVSEGIEPIPVGEGTYKDKPNPHGWMSPQNALIYVENIRRAFVELDPENADTYNENAQVYSNKILEVDRTLREELAKIPENQRFLVSCEGAFSYLVRDYGLQEVYLWAINAEQQSTPRQIQSVIDTVKANNIPAVFCETTVNDEGQRQVAQATGAKFGGNLYVDSLSAEDGNVPTFLDLLKYDAKMITSGLSN